MPSSPGYVRNNRQEYLNQVKRGESGTGSNSDNAKRHRARFEATKLGMVKPGDGKDLDHKNPISKGGSNSPSNFRVESKHANRSFPRNKDGSMIENKAKTPAKK